MTVSRTRRLLLGAAALLAVGGASLARLRAQAAPQENALGEDGLPFYTDATLRPRWRDAGRRRIGQLALRNQHGAALDASVLDGEPTVVSFFFSGCATRCPLAMELLNLSRLDMGAEAPRYLSLSVTPQLDDVAALQAYARRSGLPPSWQLATGRPDQVYRLAREQLLSDIETPGPDHQPPHTERALLVDGQRRIRGIYNATVATELLRLKFDLRRLRAEAARQRRG